MIYWLIRKMVIVYILFFVFVWLIDAALIWQIIAAVVTITYVAGWIWPSVSDEDRAEACRGPTPEEVWGNHEL